MHKTNILPLNRYNFKALLEAKYCISTIEGIATEKMP